MYNYLIKLCKTIPGLDTMQLAKGLKKGSKIRCDRKLFVPDDIRANILIAILFLTFCTVMLKPPYGSGPQGSRRLNRSVFISFFSAFACNPERSQYTTRNEHHLYSILSHAAPRFSIKSINSISLFSRQYSSS